MTDVALADRMARAIAAAVYRSQGNPEDERKLPVMAERRKAAEAAALAAIACIQEGDAIGADLCAVRRKTIV